MQNILLAIVLIVGLVAGFAAGNYNAKQCKQELTDIQVTNQAAVKILNDSIAERDKKIKEINLIYSSTKDQLIKLQKEKEDEWSDVKRNLTALTAALKLQLKVLKDRQPVLMKKLEGSTGDEKVLLEKSISLLLSEISRLNLKIESQECLRKPVPDEVLSIFK